VEIMTGGGAEVWRTDNPDEGSGDKEGKVARILGINHVAFAVKDLEDAIQRAVEVLGGEVIIRFESTAQHYIGVCIGLGDDIISFLQATDESSFVSKHIEARGMGVQHLGLSIEDLEGYVETLERRGVRVDKAGMKDENFKEALLGPRTGNGVVLQLMEWKDGPMDLSPEGRERLRRKYRETPGLRLAE
jgi:catechol 2,3-dioxygenase-like lactoylglutathione lyase family enzyme